MLRGHVSGALRHAVDLGHIPASTQAQHLVMTLTSSDEQKRELRKVLDEQQDKQSPNYHQWVTPDQFGDLFGASDADIAKVSAWLQSKGFQVEDVSKSKRVIHFGGTTGQLENAFKTEIHSYQVGAETHIANNSEISVPEALSPVIAGVTLNNFFRKGHMGPVKNLRDVKAEAAAQPNYTSSSTTHYVGPWDFATIYNTFPLLNKGITGSGSSIAVVGRSDILLSDVQTYRQIFDLPSNDPIFIHAGQDNGTEPGDDGESDLDVEISGGIAPNAQVYFVIGTPTFFVDGITNSIEYIVENNTADIMSISYGSCESVEGAGGNAFNNQAFEQAAAQGISIFVAAGDNGPAECDNSNDSYEVLGYATGGEASTPYSVSVGGSQGFEGTTAAAESPYWSSTSQQAPYWGESAISYIPEVPWNEAKSADKSDSPSADLGGLWSGSGGISSYYLQPSWQRGVGVSTTDPTLPGGDWVTGVTFTNAGSGYTTAPTVTFTGGGCVTEPVATTTISGGAVSGIVFNYGTQGGTLKGGQGFGCTSAPTVAFGAAPNGGTTATGTATIGQMYNQPQLVTGVPHRYTPDLVLNAASGHDATIFCSEGNCQTSGSGNAVSLVNAGLVGGTSVAAPSMAGIQALINQANGGRQGMPGYIYYALAAAENLTNCNSTLGNTIGTGCVFQDITQGDNLICGTSACSATNGKMGFSAGTGYDLASGLGSVNAANMSAAWSTVTFNSTSTTLNLSQTSGIAQGTPITFTGKVTPGSGTGTPTGDVAFIVSNGILGQTININDGSPNGSGAFATLNNGTYTATVSNLPGGSYTVTARYGGDSNFASSVSTPVPVTVSKGASVVTLTPGSINQTACTITTGAGASFTYGGLVWIPATVAGATGQGVPTGTVTITVDGVNWGTITLDPNGNGYLVAGAVPTTSCLYGYIFSQGALIPGGNHTIGASYSGDGTFAASTATPVSITVAPLTVTPTLAAGSTFITSGASDTLTATFGTISALTGITPGIAGPTGTVTFTDTTTSTVLGTANVADVTTFSGNTYSYSATAAAATTGITATGANSITATYSGDTNFTSTTSGPVTVTVGTGAATSVSVTSSANPTTLGGRPTFTATLTGGPTSGTVTFFDGSTVLGTGTVGTAHTATLKLGTTPAFVGGTHNITASFGGVSGTYTASTSPVLVETVTQGTAPITLTVQNNGTEGKSFTFAAVLTPSSTSATYSPNQSVVNFLDGGSTLIGTAQPITITSTQGGYGLWTATYTATLAAGTHSITATYTDVNYSLTTSAAQTVTVKAVTPSKLVFTTAPPAAAIAGGNAGTVQVALEDASGNIATTNSSAAVSILIAGPKGYSATTSGTTSNGVVSFSLSSPLTAAGVYTVTASSASMTPAQASLTVVGGPAASLAIGGVATPASLLTTYQGTITATDAYGNPAPGFTGTVALTSSDPSVTVNPTSYTFSSADAGATTFQASFRNAGTFSIIGTSGSYMASETGITVLAAVDVLNADSSISRYNTTGYLLNQSPTSGSSSTFGAVAVDSGGAAWAVSNGTLKNVSATGGAVTISGLTAAGISAPVSVALDGASNVWVVNGNNSVSELTVGGAAISPATGFTGVTTATTGGATNYSAPAGIAIDLSGNVWVSNSTANTVTEILGAATPAAPLATAVTNVTTGARP